MSGIFPNTVDGGAVPADVPYSYNPALTPIASEALYFSPIGCQNYLRPEFLNNVISLLAATIDQSGRAIDKTQPLQLAHAIQAGKTTYAVATGTANSWTIAPSLAVPAYAAGRVLWIKVPATNTSTTVIANVSGLGTRPVKKSGGADPAVSDLIANYWYPTIDDGTNIIVVMTLPSDVIAQLSVTPPVAERFSSTTSGTTTYTPTVTAWYFLELWGGGGGGGAGAGTGGGGGGGGGGRVVDYVYLIAGTPYTYTVGAPGALGPGSNNGGSSGGSSSFVGPAGTIVATAGSGGAGANTGGGGVGGTPGSGSGFSSRGSADTGQNGYQGAPQISQGGQGGSSVNGGFGGAASFGTGNDGGVPGAGGSGSSNGGNGGSGAVGRIILSRLGV